MEVAHQRKTARAMIEERIQASKADGVKAAETLPTDAVYDATATMRSRRGLPVEPSDIKATLGRLRQYSIIRDVRIKPAGGGIQESYATGIPSMATFTLTMAEPHKVEQAHEIARAHLTAGLGGPGELGDGTS